MRFHGNECRVPTDDDEDETDKIGILTAESPQTEPRRTSLPNAHLDCVLLTL